MPRPHRRRTGTEAEEVNAGRRHLAAIDPAVMRRVVGRPEQRDADPDAATAPVRTALSAVPAYRRAY